MSQEKTVDIAILVPKQDEFRALEQAFDANFAESSGKLSGGKYYYLIECMTRRVNNEHLASIAVVLIGDQGNTIACDVTRQVISELNPSIIFLTGTAAGREGKVDIGSVIASSMVVDAQEWKLDGKELPRIRHLEPRLATRTDVDRFIDKTLSQRDWLQRIANIPGKIFQRAELVQELWKRPPKAHLGYMASSNYLHKMPKELNKIWTIDDRILCIDMESGGFGAAAKSSSERQWLVVRGISDYGTPESKQEEYRVPAAAAAAIFLRMLIEEGLVESHPHRIRASESAREKKAHSKDESPEVPSRSMATEAEVPEKTEVTIKRKAPKKGKATSNRKPKGASGKKPEGSDSVDVEITIKSTVRLPKDRFELLGFGELANGIPDLIRMSFESNIITSMNCQPHPEFVESMGKRIANIINMYIPKERYLELLIAAFARAGALKRRELSIPELFENLIVMIMYFIPAKEDRALLEIASEYTGEDQFDSPLYHHSTALSISYIASTIEHSLLDDEYIIIQKRKTGEYSVILQDKCFEN
jgi:nucleoside phosphorylase